MKKNKRFELALLILIFGINAAWAQKTISINNVSHSCTFEANPQLQNFSHNNVGDTLLLDFLGDKHYKAVVLQAGKSYDGITSITAQVADTEFGYCYISVAENNIALSVEIPQKNEFFSIKKIAGKNYLIEQPLSEVQHEHDDECIHISEHDSLGIARSPQLRAVPSTLPENPAAVTVDLLVVYTPAAKAVAVQNGSDMDMMIAQGIQRSNLVLNNSLTNVTLNVVHKQEVAYTETNDPNTDLIRLRNMKDGYADEVHALRSRYKADMVVLLLGESSSNVAGAGYIMNSEYGNPNSGFSVMKAKHIAGSYTLIHEVGHNFGCGHHTDTDNIAIYSYAHGYRGFTTQGNKFSTIMTYENANGINYPRIPYFSDPNLSFEGTATGSANDANNAKTIRQTKGLIAAYSDEAPWTDSFLQDIKLSSGALSPAFNPGVYQYTVEVDNSVTSIDVQGIPNSTYSNVSGDVKAMPLTVGSNQEVKMTVEDGWGNYPRDYKITITRKQIQNNKKVIIINKMISSTIKR